MAGPGNEIAADGQDHGRLRASRADREQVIDVLKAAFVEGRLDRDEFGLRAGQALAARTYADLAALTGDIPIRSAGARLPEVARAPLSRRTVAAMTGATAAFVATFIAIGPVLAHTPDGSPSALPLVVIFFVLMMTVPTGWLVLLHYWMERRSARRLQAGDYRPARWPVAAVPKAILLSNRIFLRDRRAMLLLAYRARVDRRLSRAGAGELDQRNPGSFQYPGQRDARPLHPAGLRPSSRRPAPQ